MHDAQSHRRELGKKRQNMKKVSEKIKAKDKQNMMCVHRDIRCSIEMKGKLFI